MSRDGLTRRAVLGGLAGLGVTACGSSPTFDLLSGAVSSFKRSGNSKGYGLSDAQIEALPYASLGIYVGDAPPAITILSTIEGEDLHWVSSDRMVFVTRRGRLVKTVGLPRDLSSSQLVAADPITTFNSGMVASYGSRIFRYVDVRPDDEFAVPVESRFEVVGAAQLTILGRTHDTTLLRERVKVPKWRWKTENLFWIDQHSGRVWKSTQQYCPDVPAMTFEVLKPALEPTATGA